MCNVNDTLPVQEGGVLGGTGGVTVGTNWTYHFLKCTRYRDVVRRRTKMCIFSVKYHPLTNEVDQHWHRGSVLRTVIPILHIL